MVDRVPGKEPSYSDECSVASSFLSIALCEEILGPGNCEHLRRRRPRHHLIPCSKQLASDQLLSTADKSVQEDPTGSYQSAQASIEESKSESYKSFPPEDSHLSRISQQRDSLQNPPKSTSDRISGQPAAETVASSLHTIIQEQPDDSHSASYRNTQGSLAGSYRSASYKRENSKSRSANQYSHDLTNTSNRSANSASVRGTSAKLPSTGEFSKTASESRQADFDKSNLSGNTLNTTAGSRPLSVTATARASAEHIQTSTPHQSQRQSINRYTQLPESNFKEHHPSHGSAINQLSQVKTRDSASPSEEIYSATYQSSRKSELKSISASINPPQISASRTDRGVSTSWPTEESRRAEGSIRSNLAQEESRRSSVAQEESRRSSIPQEEHRRSSLPQEESRRSSIPQEEHRRSSLPQEESRRISSAQEERRSSSLPQEESRRISSAQEEYRRSSVPQGEPRTSLAQEESRTYSLAQESRRSSFPQEQSGRSSLAQEVSRRSYLPQDETRRISASPADSITPSNNYDPLRSCTESNRNSYTREESLQHYQSACNESRRLRGSAGIAVMSNFRDIETQTVPIQSEVAGNDAECRCREWRKCCSCPDCDPRSCHYDYDGGASETPTLTDDQLSDYSDESYATDFLDLSYQNNEEYMELLQELEKKLIARNRERVRRTMQEFERRSRQNQNLEKPVYEESTSPTRRHKPGKPRGRFCCCKCGAPPEDKINSDILQNEKKWEQLSFLESVVKRDTQGKKVHKFEKPLHRSHWQIDPRSGEWVKASEFSRGPKHGDCEEFRTIKPPTSPKEKKECHCCPRRRM